uniref:Uncharacterized protein n=1 Tax=Bionectria ochroleuca TaxID=29856 RepID=A0A8H7NI44_BIOOC
MFSQGPNNLTTLANQPEAVPPDSCFWRPSNSDYASAGKVTEALCDFRTYMVRQSQAASDRDCCEPVMIGDSVFYQWKACWLFGRPCTWTASLDRCTPWGSRQPYLCTAKYPLTPISTGDYRRLAFHRTTEQDLSEAFVPEEPLEGVDGLGLALEMEDSAGGVLNQVVGDEDDGDFDM